LDLKLLIVEQLTQLSDKPFQASYEPWTIFPQIWLWFWLWK